MKYLLFLLACACIGVGSVAAAQLALHGQRIPIGLTLLLIVSIITLLRIWYAESQ